MLKRSVLPIVLLGLVPHGWFGPNVRQWARPPDASIERGAVNGHIQGQMSDRAAALQQVQGLVGRADDFNDPDPKIRTLILLADVLWGKGKDATSGRQLFMKSFELLKTLNDKIRSESSTRNEAARTGGTWRQSASARSLRLLLIEYAARHDAALAKRFSTDDVLVIGDASKRGDSDNRDIAESLIKAGEFRAAAPFIKEAFDASGADKTQLMLTVHTLLNLREGDRKSADTLFALALSALAAKPGVGVDHFLVLGTYLFTCQKLLSGMPCQGPSSGIPPTQVIVIQIRVGDVFLAADITADRGELSPTTVRAFLLSILGMKQRPMDNLEARRYVAAAYLLLPKAQKYAPDLVGELNVVLASARFVAPPAAEDRPVALESTTDDLNFQKSLRKLDEIKDQQGRDEYSLSIVKSYYASNNFKSATIFADKISDLPARGTLLELIGFRQAAKLIEGGELDAAEDATRALAPDARRARLSLGLAQAFLKRGDERRARENLGAALKSLSSNSTHGQQAQLLLSAAERFGPVDPARALELLRDAVRAFNRIENSDLVHERLPDSVKVTLGKRSAAFDTRVRGAEPGTFYGALKPLVHADLSAARDTVLDLNSERVLSAAIPALASAILDDLIEKPNRTSKSLQR